MALSRMPGSWNQEPSVTRIVVFRCGFRRSCRLASSRNSAAASARENPGFRRPLTLSHGISFAVSKFAPSFR